MDDLILGDAGSGYNAPLGLIFACPEECLPAGADPRGSSKPPGIYLRGEKSGKSPTALPHHPERLLTQEEALEHARHFDHLSRQVSAHGSGFNRLAEQVQYPASWEEFVREWYAAIGRRLHRAIEAADTRRSDLREAYAAITGRSYA